MLESDGVEHPTLSHDAESRPMSSLTSATYTLLFSKRTACREKKDTCMHAHTLRGRAKAPKAKACLRGGGGGC